MKSYTLKKVILSVVLILATLITILDLFNNSGNILQNIFALFIMACLMVKHQEISYESTLTHQHI